MIPREEVVGRIVCNSQPVINIPGLFPQTDEIKLRLIGMCQSTWPGQATIYVMPEGAAGFDYGAKYNTTGFALVNGAPNPNPAPVSGLLQSINNTTGLFINPDFADAGAFPWDCDVTITACGTVQGIAQHTRYKSRWSRNDSGGNMHVGEYVGVYTGAPGLRPVCLQLAFAPHNGVPSVASFLEGFIEVIRVNHA